MTREERKDAINSIKAIRERFLRGYGEDTVIDVPIDGDDMQALDRAISALSENKGEWIPLKTRPMTEEEATFYRDWAEYGAEIFDCPLPDDGQEVLISCGGYVGVDTFVKDDGCYFEGVDIEDVDAWQPLPEPYEKGGE